MLRRWLSLSRAPWAAVLLLTGMALFRVSTWPADPDRSINQQVLAEGEALRYGLETGAPMSQAMPGSSLLTLFRHADSPPGVKRHLPRLLMIVSLILVFGLGKELHSPACGLLAALALSVLGRGWVSGNEENVFMALTVLVAAHFAARRARSPDTRGGILLGLAVGASLMIRSSLWLYPFVLSAYELSFHRGRTLRTRLRLLLPVWAAAILILLPWIGMNYGIHGRFIPFEDSRYDESVVSGALGLISVVDGGDVFKMAGITREDDVLRWAAGEVLRHPLRYAASCAVRAWHAALLQPLIFLSAVFSFWYFRKKEEHRQVELLAAYYFGIHCMIGTTERFFFPLWPLAAVLAASVPAFWLDKREPKRSPPGLVWAGALPVFALALAAAILAGSYPLRRDGSLEKLEGVLRIHPRDAWLLGRRGRERMKREGGWAAVRDFSDAMTLDPRPSRRLDYAWAVGMQGVTAARVLAEIRRDDPFLTERSYIVEGESLLLRGEEKAAREAFRLSREAARKACGQEWDAGASEDVRRKLCADAQGPGEELLELLGPLPTIHYAAALGELGTLAREGANRSIIEARRAVAAGDRPRARRELERAAAVASLDAAGGTQWRADTLRAAAELRDLVY